MTFWDRFDAAVQEAISSLFWLCGIPEPEPLDITQWIPPTLLMSMYAAGSGADNEEEFYA